MSVLESKSMSTLSILAAEGKVEAFLQRWEREKDSVADTEGLLTHFPETITVAELASIIKSCGLPSPVWWETRIRNVCDAAGLVDLAWELTRSSSLSHKLSSDTVESIEFLIVLVYDFDCTSVTLKQCICRFASSLRDSYLVF